MGRIQLAALAMTALVATACTAPAGSTPASTGSWRLLPPGPLSPREQAIAVGVGGRVLVVGGSDTRPCPPAADCALPEEPPLNDGAVFDVRTGQWQRIGPAPVPMTWADSAVVGSTVYLWSPGSPRTGERQAFVSYNLDSGMWDALPVPPVADDRACCHITLAGDRIVAYSGTDEWGEVPDHIFDPSVRRWAKLPPDPLSPSFDRSMVSSGSDLVLLDHELVPQPGSDRPSLTRAAMLDLESGRWRRLPDSQMLGVGEFVAVGGRLVNPSLGWADGGQNEWGRRYPNGGILDPTTGRWSSLPEGPGGRDEWSAGVLASDAGHYVGDDGWLLDLDAGDWIDIPPRPAEHAAEADGEMVSGGVVASADRSLFVFGGVRWLGGKSLEGELLTDAWLWTP
jgi:hypothetical protein